VYIVAVNEAGRTTAFRTIWLDGVTRAAAFEPAGTHPGRPRRGQGKAATTTG